MCIFPKVIVGLLILMLTPALCLGSYMGDIQLEFPSPSWLGQGEWAFISFDYKIDEPAGARFFVRPYANGSPVPGYSWSGSAVYTGQGSHTTWWAVNSGSPVVDHYSLAMVSTDWNTTYLELYIPVEYNYGPHGIMNIEYSHGLPSYLGNSQDLVINFDYRTTEPEVLIYARPFTDGSLTPGYSASGSVIHAGPTGSGDQEFTFNSGLKDVDEIRFQMKTVDQTQVLLEFFVPVDFHWGPHGAMNFSLSPASGQHLPFEEHIVLSFDYITSDPGGVRLFAQACDENGNPISYGAYQPSPLETDPSGSRSRFCFLDEDSYDVPVSFIRFRMVNDGPTETYLDVLLPVDYDYDAEAVNAVAYTPAPPAILDQEENVTVFFDYDTSEAAGVRIFPRPFSGGLICPNYSADPSPLYPWESGSGSSNFTINTGDIHVDQTRFQVYSADNTTLLHTMFYPARHYFGQSAVATGATDNAPAARVELLAAVPNPFNPKTTLSFRLPAEQDVRLAIYDARGRLLDELLAGTLSAGEHQVVWEGQDRQGRSMPSGVYFYRLDTNQGPLTGKAVLLK